jgi:hypothetical protein
MRHTDIKPKYDNISIGIVGMTDARIIEEVIHLLRREGVPQHEIEEFRTQTHTYSPNDFSVFLRIILSWVKVIEMGSDHVACLDEGEEELWITHDEHEANLELEADLHGTGTQMYKDTLMLLERAKKDLGI